MHDGVHYDPIQGQGQRQGHEALKVGNHSISAIYNGSWLLRLWPLILKLGHNI